MIKTSESAEYFALMCDETTDVSNNEQEVICIRSVDNESFEISENIAGFNQLASTKSDVIFEMLRLELLRD